MGRFKLKDIKQNFKITEENLPFLLICTGFFATPFLWRKVWFSGFQTALFNPLVWLGIVLMVARNHCGREGDDVPDQERAKGLFRPDLTDPRQILLIVSVFVLAAFLLLGIEAESVALFICPVLCPLFFLYVSRRETPIGRRGLTDPLWIILIAAVFVLTISNLERDNMVEYLYATLCPLFFLYISISDEDTVRYVGIFTRALTIVCTVIVLCGVIDMVTGFTVSRFIAEYTQTASLLGMLKEGRMVSYMGHPLQTVELMLLCFLFNTLHSFYLKEKTSIVYVIYYSLISAAGIGMSGGKSGLVLLAVSFVVLYANKTGFKYILFILVAGVAAWRLGLLDTAINRLVTGITTGNLTTGRFKALSKLWNSGELTFEFFRGHAGETMSTDMISALEFPPLRWAYQFGIWFSIAVSGYLFLPPLIKAIKAKNIPILAAMLILMLDVNTYNGLTTLSDLLLLYCVAVFLLLNLLRVIEAKKK